MRIGQIFLGFRALNAQVMENAIPNMSTWHGEQQVWRAQFSSLAPVDLKWAMANLGSPNKAMSDSVDARADAWRGVFLSVFLVKETFRGL